MDSAQWSRVPVVHRVPDLGFGGTEKVESKRREDLLRRKVIRRDGLQDG